MHHRGRNKAFVYLTDASASFFFSGRHHPDRNNHSNCRHTLLDRTIFSLSTGLQNSAALVQLMACVFMAYEMSQLELTLKFCSIQHASKKGNKHKIFSKFETFFSTFLFVSDVSGMTLWKTFGPNLNISEKSQWFVSFGSDVHLLLIGGHHEVKKNKIFRYFMTCRNKKTLPKFNVLQKLASIAAITVSRKLQ